MAVTVIAPGTTNADHLILTDTFEVGALQDLMAAAEVEMFDHFGRQKAAMLELVNVGMMIRGRKPGSTEGSKVAISGGVVEDEERAITTGSNDFAIRRSSGLTVGLGVRGND